MWFHWYQCVWAPWVYHETCMGLQGHRSWRYPQDSRPQAAEHLYWGSAGRTLTPGVVQEPSTAASPPRSPDPYPYTFWPPTERQSTRYRYINTIRHTQNILKKLLCDDWLNVQKLHTVFDFVSLLHSFLLPSLISSCCTEHSDEKSISLWINKLSY